MRFVLRRRWPLLALLALSGAHCQPSDRGVAGGGSGAVSSRGYLLTAPNADAKAKRLAELTRQQVRVTQQADTEAPGTGALLHEERAGLFVCVVCGLPLFHSSAKFDSGTGWPSFFAPFAPDHVVVRSDSSLGIPRDEIVCGRDGAHLGHVFDDGPAPTGKRYCLNSASLRFFAEGETLPADSKPIEAQTAYFAGG